MNPKASKIMAYALATYLALGLGLLLFEDAIVLHPKKLKSDYLYSFPKAFEEGVFSPEKGVLLHTLYFKPDSSAKGLVLYLHGNADNMQRWAKHAPEFTKRGYAVLFYDYRGFGKSTGKTSQQNLLDDARKLYDSLNKHVPESQISIYGRSLGTGVGTYLASKNKPKQVVLETPYYNLPDVAFRHLPIYPYNLLSHFQMPSNEWIKGIKCPIHAFHGTKDEIVPYASAVALMKNTIQENTLTTLPEGKHRGLDKYADYQHKMNQLFP